MTDKILQSIKEKAKKYGYVVKDPRPPTPLDKLFDSLSTDEKIYHYNAKLRFKRESSQ